MSAHELVYLAMSPFSQKARWALDAAGVNYTTTPYNLTAFYIQELPLRWRIGNLTGKITAPILITAAEGDTKSQIIMDSTGIAKWAQQQTSTNVLFPTGAEEDVLKWVKTVDSMSSLMRIGIATAGSSNSAVINAMLPPGATGLSAAVGRHLTARTFRKIGNKYTDVDSTVEKDQVLSELRAAQQQIDTNPNRLLIASSTAPSYADICLAVAFNWLVGFTKVPIATTAADGQQQSIADVVPEFQLLLKEFGGLVAWSAEVAKKHWPAAAEVYQL